MKLSVIIVSYNVKYYLWQCLYSLEKALNGISSEIIVFDNHSRDGSVEYLSSAFPEVTFISGSHNLGFARANNHAIRQSNGDYVLLLNPDTIICEDTIHKALSFIDSHPNAGAIGVRMIKTDGSDAKESRRGIPTPMTAFYKMSGLCTHFPNSHKLGKYYMGWLSWDEPGKIEVVSGAFCLLRRKALNEVGLLDKDFFMYGEDIDLSYRLLKGGWENWYLPLRILHYKGESTQKSSFRYVHVFYEAMLIFFRKHYKHLGVLLSFPIKLAIYAKALSSLMAILLNKARRNLGFVNVKQPTDALFIFYVRPENMQHCQQMAKHKGLWSEFHDAGRQGEGVEVEEMTKQKIYITFDASAFTFKEMLDNLSQIKQKNVTLATYYPIKNIIITNSDVLL